jgi:phosphatidate cytidylyltransferase
MRKQRVISAIILLAIAITATVVGSYALGALIFLFIVAGMYEIFKAFEAKGLKPMKVPGFAFASLFLLQVVFRRPDIFHLTLFEKDVWQIADDPSAAMVPRFSWTGPIIVLLILVILTILVIKHDKYTPIDAAVTVFGALYVTVLTSYAFSLRDLEGGKSGLFIFLLAFLTDVAADTMAYEVGSRIGKHKLIPAVSPKKTVEGSVGSFIGAILAALILGMLFIFTGWFTRIALYWYPVIGLVVGFVSQIGDLAASVIKRYAGIKDFSNLIPGHGGVIDRLDSLMFVFPLVYYFVRLVM